MIPNSELTNTDNLFDVAICSHVFEHIQDDKKAMAEFFRVLKPGGWAIVQVPLRTEKGTLEVGGSDSPEKRLRCYGQVDHVRYYGWQDVADRLTAAGFRVSIEQPALHMEVETLEKYRLIRDERIYMLFK